jgi:hypothetical protein
MDGSSLSVYSIGSQSIVSNTITGSNNAANISPQQSSTNSGSVATSGSIQR